MEPDRGGSYLEMGINPRPFGKPFSTISAMALLMVRGAKARQGTNLLNTPPLLAITVLLASLMDRTQFSAVSIDTAASRPAKMRLAVM